MSCVIGVGVVLVELAPIALAVGATAVVMIQERVQQKTLEGLLKDEVSTVVASREDLQRHKISERLREDNVADRFADADALIETAKGEVIGFRQLENGHWELAAKHGVEGVEELTGTHEEIEARLMQQYAYEKVKREAEKRGYAVLEEELLEDNSIRVLVRRWY